MLYSEPRKGSKPVSYEEARIKGASYCAYQERCQQEVRDKLYSFGLHRKEVEELISYFITEAFINEERFSRAFAGGKFRINKWGKVRIIQELKARKISNSCIQKGLEEISDKEYDHILKSLINKKYESLRDPDIRVKKKKVSNYMLNKGFEGPLVWDNLNELN